MDRATAFGQVIRGLRKAAPLTQAQMADRLAGVQGLGQADLSKIENGRHGSPEMHLASLASALGVRSSEITSRVDLLMEGAEVDFTVNFSPHRRPVSRIAEIATKTGDSLRIDLIAAEADMGDGRINEDFPEVIRAVEFPAAYIRSVVGFLPPPGRLVLVTGRGDSMIPVIQPGDSVIVDTGVAAYDGDGLYLINLGNGQQIKRLVDHGKSAGVYAHSDNKAYPELPMPKDAIVGGKVYLRARVDRFN